MGGTDLERAARLLARSLAATTSTADALADEKLAQWSSSGADVRVPLDARRAAISVRTSPESNRVWLAGSLARAGDGVFGAPPDLAALRDTWTDRLADASRDALTVVTGGPPGSYFVSGLDARDDETLRSFRAAGFVDHSRHVDLHVVLKSPRRDATSPSTAHVDGGRTNGGRDDSLARVDVVRVGAMPDEAARILAWIGQRFSSAWALEAALALSHNALWVAWPEAVSTRAGSHAEREPLGFAAHSGNNAALGTFGPIGVDENARGHRLGSRLAQTALDDLASRGFERATIPWVDTDVVRFYERLVASFEVLPRIVLRSTLERRAVT